MHLQFRLYVTLAVLFVVAVTPGAWAQTTPVYRDSTHPLDERVRDLLGRMTLEEKFWQLFMIPGRTDDSAADYSHGVFGLQTRTAPNAKADAQLQNVMQRYLVEHTRLGVPMIPFEEAVHGLMRRGATVFPAAIALAATWDTAVVGEVATAIAREARSRGVRQVLSPVVNIATDVRWGRVEETYGEDPALASAMARAYVRPFTRAGVITTPKHFVANVGEGGRDSYPIELNRRALEEIHFPPFRAALDAGAQSIMTAYNSVDGMPATQSRWLLTETLRNEWRFPGFVISDQSATAGPTVLQHTEASTATAVTRALDAGLDVVFESSWRQHRAYLDAFERRLIDSAVIDSAVARVLRAKFQRGLFEHPYVDADSAAIVNDDAAHRRLARTAATESIVLLKNAGSMLPFASRVRSIAVIGTDASEARLGGYTLDDARGISILDALRARQGIAVRYAPGPGRITREVVRVPSAQLSGLRGEYWDNIRLEGPPHVVRADSMIDFAWTINAPAQGVSGEWYSVRWTGRLLAPSTGVRRLGVEGSDGYRLYLDGKLLFDDWQKRSSSRHLATVSLRPGTTHDIRLEFFETTGNGRVRLVWDAGVVDDWRARIASAVASVRRADATVVVAGVEEGEFRDRARLSLPGHQEELIEAVAATGKPSVVVLIGGSAITMSRWLDRVGAVVDAWYPGEEGGSAIADVLFGDANPAGRLPVTFPISEGQLPLVYNHKPTGRGDDYVDRTGQPLFPFGYGLSYTTFEYSDLRIDGMDVSFRVRNTGARPGDEVAQLYLHDVLATVSRPVEELKRFARVHLAPGEDRELRFTLRREDLEFLNENMQRVLEPGVFRVLVGASSRDIRLRGELVVP
ncbi:MAG TPA: glycoside hydrolase family 3 N-terminal domain-containing protein [Gemmatimonadaceae bacterium]|nr:glycoside hydrolase family 3 N-terminal domain-containing protein [Gemmatimonadaceae bacterium]